MLEVQKRPVTIIREVSRVKDSLILVTDRGRIKLEPKAPGIVRIVYTLRDDFSQECKPGVVNQEAFPHWDYQQSEDEICLSTDLLKLRISLATASIRYYDANNHLLLKERDYESRTLEEFDSFKTIVDKNTQVEQVETPDGIKEVIKGAVKVFDRKLYKTRLYLEWQKEEALYGLGQSEEGDLNLRGTTQYLHQANMKIAIPMLVSSLGYGILMDTYSPMIFSDSKHASYLYTEADVEMDYYFIYGKNMDGVVRGYRQLTGKAVMLPKWAFGFLQSQERYETAEEIQSIVQEYRRRKIGLDCIILDWCYWEEGKWGQKSFDSARFESPSDLMQKLHADHAQLMISIWPNMNKNCENYEEFKNQDLLLQGSSIYDPYQEKGRSLYWKQAEEGLYRHGIDAWWCDSSEPFTPEWNHKVKPEPSAMYHEFYETACQHIPSQLTNSYGLFHARTIYEGQRAVTDEKRVVNLTRNGYLGQQRYGAILWSGDISASWDTYRRQITSGLNFCASGIPYWTLDIGGFFIKKGVQWFWNGEYENGSEDLGYRELFVRWFQYGCFLPVFRSHGTDIRRELWKFGDKGDPFYDSLIKMIELRYQLMPYIYSMAAKVWKDDYTLMRMLAFDYPSDSKARETEDQFLFGDCLMVCPVTKAMYYEKNSMKMEETGRTREVYLPEGNGWYDFWTNEYYQGGQTITASAPLDTIPLYVKEGSILPMTVFMQYVDEIPDAPVEVRVYSGKNASFTIYEDEGNSYRYEDGEYILTEIVWSEQDQKLQVGEPTGTYRGFLPHREYKLNLIRK